MASTNDYTMINSAFGELARVNEAIADAIFHADMAGVPAYLDIEDAQETAIGTALAIPAQDVRSHIVTAVKAVVNKPASPKRAFQRFARAHEKWLVGDRLETPPVLSLLAVFSIAAENMHAEGGFGANNYYGRLAELLGMKKKDVEGSYREVCDSLWSALNAWLDAWEGARGIATVVATEAHPYVSKAISQALIQANDRTAFARLFASYGLEPQQALDPEDMAGYLNEWIPRHGTVHLKNLWKKEDLREVIESVCSI